MTDFYLQGEEYYRRAASFYDKTNYADAVRNFDKAAEYFKRTENRIKLVEALSGKAISLDSLGKYNKDKYDEAISCFDEVIEKCKDDPMLITQHAISLHHKAYSLGNLRKYNEAIRCFDDAMGLLDDMQKKGENPDHTLYADILRNKAYAYAMSKYDFEDPSEGDWEKATEYLVNAEKMDGNFAYLWNTHGYINLIYRREREAIKCFDEAIKIDPKLTTAWYNKGYALSISSSSEYEQALKCFDEAIRIDPNSSFSWHYRGYAMLKSGDFEKALESFNRAIEIDPSFVEAWISKGTCLISLKKFEQAHDSFVRAMINLSNKIVTPVPHWYYYMHMVKSAYVFNDVGIALDSIRIHGEGRKRFGDEARNQFDIAIGIYKELKAYFHDTICINPDIASVLYNKGYSLGNLGKYAEAKECFDEAKTLFEAYCQARGLQAKDEFKTEYANILRNIGFLCFKLGHHEEAVRYYDMATREDPSFALAWNSKGYHIIVCYDKLIERKITSKTKDDLKGEAISYFEEAIKCFQKKGETDPHIAYAYYNKGYALFLLKKYEDAVQCFEDATKVKPTYADAWIGKGVCTYLYLHNKNKIMPFTELMNINKYFDEAISSYAIDRDDNQSDQENLAYIFYNKAIVLKQLGRYEQAVEYFDQAIISKQQFFYEPWYSKGIILNYLKRYNEAIDCFDQAIEHYNELLSQDADENVKFDLHVARGQAKYNIGDSTGALKDFKAVGDENLIDRRKSQKYNNIGIYYHQDGEYKKAQSKYEDAITNDPTSIDAYYNLAILHINKNEIKEAKKIIG